MYTAPASPVKIRKFNFFDRQQQKNCLPPSSPGRQNVLGRKLVPWQAGKQWPVLRIICLESIGLALYKTLDWDIHEACILSDIFEILATLVSYGGVFTVYRDICTNIDCLIEIWSKLFHASIKLSAIKLSIKQCLMQNEGNIQRQSPSYTID